MEKYSIVIPKCGSHILLRGCLKSIEENLTPDEIIIVDNKYKYSCYGAQSGPSMHKAYGIAKNNLILSLDMDTLVTNPRFIEGLMEAIKPDDVFCAAAEWWRDRESQTDMYSAGAALVKKDKYFQTVGYSGTGQPSWRVNNDIREKGWKAVLVNVSPYWFHMTKCNKTHYNHGMMAWLARRVKGWSHSHGYNWEETMNKYYPDTGMDKVDLDCLNSLVMNNVQTAMNRRLPFSTMRLGDLGLRSLITYLLRDRNEADSKEFTRLNTKHPDLGLPDRETTIRLTEELIRHLRRADYIDHPKLYKGATGALYQWRGILRRADWAYETAGITNKRFCHPLQGYLGFVKDFEYSFYKLVKKRRILYVGPWDEMGKLNERKPLSCAKLGFYQLSMSNDHSQRLSVMERFFDTHNPEDWDLIIVTGSLYGRILIGRIKEKGGRAFDMGQAVRLNPNNVFEVAVKVVDGKTAVELIDHMDYNILDSYTNMERQKIAIFSLDDLRKKIKE